MNAVDSGEILKIFFGVLAVIVGIPMLILMARVGMFFGSLSRSVSVLETAATAFTQKVDKILDRLVDQVNDHEIRIQISEQFIDASKIEKGWAPDRRHRGETPAAPDLHQRGGVAHDP